MQLEKSGSVFHTTVTVHRLQIWKPSSKLQTTFPFLLIGLLDCHQFVLPTLISKLCVIILASLNPR